MNVSAEVRKGTWMLLLLSTTAAVLGQHAPKAVRCDQDIRFLGGGGEVEVLHVEHPLDTLGAEEVLLLPSDTFEPSNGERFQFGYTQHGHWLRFHLLV
ncbi:MAG: hypothetical protein D6765_11890, partial [Bacteroidetes bacterium]